MSVFSSPWLYIGIIISFLVIAIIFAIYGKPAPEVNDVCSPDQQSVCDPPRCVTKCPPEKPIFNCTTNTCDCPAGKIACENGECCPVGLCNSGICCDKKSVVMKNGKAICCEGGSVASKDGTSCVVPCGPAGSGRACGSNEACVKIENVSADMANKLKSILDFNEHGVIDGKTAYICQSKNSTCNFGNQQTVPSILPTNISPCYNLSNVKIDDNGVGYCGSSSSDPAKIAQCRALGKSACGGTCVWRDLMQDVSNDYGPNNQKTVIDRLSKELGFQTEQGYYCSPDKSNYGKFVAFGKKDGVCTWRDCFNKIAQPGVTNVNWNSSNNICTALVSCDSNSLSGLQNSVRCDNASDPGCAGKKPGDFIPNPNVIRYPNSFKACGSNPTSNCPENLEKKTYQCNPSGQISLNICKPISGSRLRIYAPGIGFLRTDSNIVTAGPQGSFFYISDPILMYNKPYPIKSEGVGMLTIYCSKADQDPKASYQLYISDPGYALSFKFVNQKFPFSTQVSPVCQGDTVFIRIVSGFSRAYKCPDAPDQFYKKGAFQYVPCASSSTGTSCFFQYRPDTAVELPFQLMN